MEKVTVKYQGIGPKGTLTPRRMWRPGDKLLVDPTVAKRLLKESGFVKVRVRKPRRKKETKPKTPAKKDPPKTEDDDPPEE